MGRALYSYIPVIPDNDAGGSLRDTMRSRDQNLIPDHGACATLAARACENQCGRPVLAVRKLTAEDFRRCAKIVRNTLHEEVTGIRSGHRGESKKCHCGEHPAHLVNLP